LITAGSEINAMTTMGVAQRMHLRASIWRVMRRNKE
jgi:hypothetical protein